MRQLDHRTRTTRGIIRLRLTEVTTATEEFNALFVALMLFLDLCQSA
jgi:hypothetical protein